MILCVVFAELFVHTWSGYNIQISTVWLQVLVPLNPLWLKSLDIITNLHVTNVLQVSV